MKFKTDQPIYLQIAIQIKEWILNGNYAIGDKLPSVRELSILFEVSALTIQRALAQLELEEILIPKKGVGSFVAQGCQSSLEHEMVIEQTREYIRKMKNLGLTGERIKLLVEEELKHE
jgi:GntR family transcriptional regulator